MENIKNFILLTLLCLSNIITLPAGYYQQVNLLAQQHANTIKTNTPQATAERLLNASYISPEMNWELLTFLQKTEMEIDPRTGAVQGIPPAGKLLELMSQKLTQPITAMQKEVMKNALHTMLEATEIALFVAKVEATFDGQDSPLANKVDEQIIAALNQHKTGIQNLMKSVNSITPLDQASQSSSYFAWFWTPSPAKKSNEPLNTFIPFHENDTTVKIPAAYVPMLIQNNDYKTKPDAAQGANLLFKECFIAQQHHLKDQTRIDQIKINLQSPISGTNYIYDKFPSFYEICQIAKNIAHQGGARYSLHDPLSPQHMQAHQLLLHTRQAVQTAMYIANKKSGVNVGYLLPASVSSYLDGIVNQLLQYDNFIAPLCKNPQYGATLKDINEEAQWTTIKTIAAGVVITGVTLVALHWFGLNPVAAAKTAYSAIPSINDVGTYVGKAKNALDISSWWNGSNSQTSPGESVSTETLSQQPQSNSWFSGWWPNSQNNPEPFIGPKQQEQSLLTTTLANAAYYGAQAAKAAGIVSLLTTGAQLAHNFGIVPLDPITKDYIDKANRISMIGGALVGSVAGAAGASLGVVGGNWKSLFGIYDIIQSGKNAYASGQGAVNIGQQLVYEITPQQAQQQNIQVGTPQAPALQQATFLPAQNIYNGLAKEIDASINQGINPLGHLSNGIVYILQNNLTTPDNLMLALQDLQTRYAQVPALANSIAEHMQALTQIYTGEQASTQTAPSAQ